MTIPLTHIKIRGLYDKKPFDNLICFDWNVNTKSSWVNSTMHYSLIIKQYKILPADSPNQKNNIKNKKIIII